MNTARLSKLAWKIKSDDKVLCSDILMSKYNKRITCSKGMEAKSTESSLWKHLNQAMNKTQHGARWEIGDDKTIDFWNDCWIEADVKLSEACKDKGTHHSRECLINMVDDTRRWNWELFKDKFDSNIVSKIKVHEPRNRCNTKIEEE